MTTTCDAASTETSCPSWQNEPCPSWCTWAPHREDELPVDRYHVSAEMRRSLPLEPPQLIANGGGCEPEYVAAYLWQHVRERTPRVLLCKGENKVSFTLTLDDAEALGGILTSLATQARAE